MRVLHLDYASLPPYFRLNGCVCVCVRRGVVQGLAHRGCVRASLYGFLWCAQRETDAKAHTHTHTYTHKFSLCMYVCMYVCIAHVYVSTYSCYGYRWEVSTYAFKPVAVADALKHFACVLWLDSGIELRQGSGSRFCAFRV